MSARDPLAHGWWLASRASGILALILVSVSVGIGLSLAGRIGRRPGLAKKLLAIHEQTAIAGLVAIAIHGLTLIGDAWLRPGLSGIAVPFAGSYRPFFTGLGIVAGYLAAALGLSFYVRRRIGPALWRRVHRLTFGVWVLAMVHTLGAGTDASAPWLRELMIAGAIPILLLFLNRLRPRRRRSRTRVASAA